MKMKLSSAVAVTVLVLALCSPGQSQYGHGPGQCCLTYYSKRIPPRSIKSYNINHPNCPKKGVLLITLKGRKLCADPNHKEVQNIIEKLDNLSGR